MTRNQREPDDGFAATAKEIKAIKAVVAEIAEAEDGIARHQAGIMAVTTTLVVGYYRLGSMLLSLPGAAGALKMARGAWRKRAVELCGTKDRVYMARDVFSYFEDPRDHTVRVSGKTGEERAKAFDKNLGELGYLIKDRKFSEAARRKREREVAAEDPAKAATTRDAAPAKSEEPPVDFFSTLRKVGRPVRASDDASVSEVTDSAVRLDTDAPRRPPVKEEGDEYLAYAASEFVNHCGDVQQAIAYLIDHRWNRPDALKWLAAWADEEQTA